MQITYITYTNTKGVYTMKVAYVRVSTVEQNEGRQLEALKKYDIEKWFIEKVSGKDTNRTELKNMLDFVREGDTVVVHDFSRLARSTKDLLEIVELLNNKGVALVSNHESIDTSTPSGKLMLTMLGAIAEFERTNLLERQAEGIALAKKEGKYKGRKPVEVENKVWELQYSRYKNREINKTELAKALKVSRPTLDKMIADYNKIA
jgi:DNA invertase Pin-like site-specific DNA recombinase